MIMQKWDESRREAVIQGCRGNHTKRHALTMATELARGNLAEMAAAATAAASELVLASGCLRGACTAAAQYRPTFKHKLMVFTAKT